MSHIRNLVRLIIDFIVMSILSSQKKCCIKIVIRLSELPVAKNSFKFSKFLKNISQARPNFVYFRLFLDTMINIVQKTINGKRVDGVLEIWTRDCRMEDADESTEQWWPPISPNFDFAEQNSQKYFLLMYVILNWWNDKMKKEQTMWLTYLPLTDLYLMYWTWYQVNVS